MNASNGASDTPFDFGSMDALYRSPMYLRATFREYLYGFDKGIYWLRAPSNTGKTMFVRGLVAKRLAKDEKSVEGIDSNVATGVRAIAVHLRRVDLATPQQFVDALHAAFAGEFALTDAERGETAVNVTFTDPAVARAEFLTWLQKLQAVAATKGAQRLLIAVDGIEQFAPSRDEPANAVTIIDLLPAGAEVPAGVVFLLTSQPADAWPSGMFERATEKFANGFGCKQRDVPLTDDAYEKMLRLYFWDTVRPMFRSRAMAHLEQLLENKARLSSEKDPRISHDTTFRDALKGDWKKLTNKHSRYSMNQLPVGDLKQTLDQIDKLWADAMERSERRFAYMSLILKHVVSGALPLDRVSELAQGASMLGSLEEMGLPTGQAVPA